MAKRRKADQLYIDQMNEWIKGQYVALEQQEYNSEYNRKEIELHKRALVNSVKLAAHYHKSILNAEEELREFINRIR